MRGGREIAAKGAKDLVRARCDAQRKGLKGNGYAAGARLTTGPQDQPGQKLQFGALTPSSSDGAWASVRLEPEDFFQC